MQEIDKAGIERYIHNRAMRYGRVDYDDRVNQCYLLWLKAIPGAKSHANPTGYIKKYIRINLLRYVCMNKLIRRPQSTQDKYKNDPDHKLAKTIVRMSVADKRYRDRIARNDLGFLLVDILDCCTDEIDRQLVMDRANGDTSSHVSRSYAFKRLKAINDRYNNVRIHK